MATNGEGNEAAGKASSADGEAACTVSASEQSAAGAPSPEVAQALKDFASLERRRYALRSAQNYYDFAEITTDPPEAATGRGVAYGEMDAMDHELLCGDEAGKLLATLSGAEGLSDLQANEVKVFTRDREQRQDVPAELEAALSRQESAASAAWTKARAANDWTVFAPELDALVKLFIEAAHAQDPKRDPYDVWLDRNEPGSSQATLDPFFSQVGSTVSGLVKNVRKDLTEVVSEPAGPFDGATQRKLFFAIAKLEGLDLDRLTLGETIHPVTCAVDSHHVMIANHTDENDVVQSSFSMLHESGHAMYETHINSAFDYTCLANGVSAGIHEGQSRFYENYVGRHETFAPVLLGLLRQYFPKAFESWTANDLWRHVNHVKPSWSRMEADELTYPLHIEVRYQVERALFSGEVSVAGVPKLWNSLYEKLLGVTPQDDLHGALQDVHWSIGLFGYFPSYALAGAIGAQMLSTMRKDGIAFEDVLASGDLSPIASWLAEHIWRYGRSKEPEELLLSATGSKLDPSYYLHYLEDKFAAR